MRCPQCGQWNRASIPTCQKCGARLFSSEEEREPEQPVWKDELKGGHAQQYIRVDEDGEIGAEADARDTLADEMTELKRRKEMGARQQRRLRIESARRGSAPSGMTIRTHASVDTFWSHMDEPEEEEAPRRPTTGSRIQVRRPGDRRAEEGGSWADSRELDPLWMEERRYDSASSLPSRNAAPPKLPTRHKHLRRFLYTMVLLLCGALLAVGGYFGWQWYQSHRAVTAAASRAQVTASIKNDLAAHTIMIPGTDGQQIYIRELHTNYMVVDGYATV